MQFPNKFVFLKTFLPPRANSKKNCLSQHSFQGKSKKNTFTTTFLPSRVAPKEILYFYHNLPSIQVSPKRIPLSYNLPSIQGSSKRNIFITTFLPSREVPGQFHEIRKLYLISKYWFMKVKTCLGPLTDDHRNLHSSDIDFDIEY